MTSSAPSPGLFFETINAYQRTQALRAAIELDLFSAIASGNRSAAEIAAACAASLRGIRVLADYLTIAGFLTKEGETYALTPDSAVFLTRQSPAYLGGTLDFLLTPSLTDCFQDLTQVVRHGGTVVSAEGTVSAENLVWVDFARAMAPLMQLPARLMADRVCETGPAPLRILDVAAGHGAFGIEFAKRIPAARVTALDWGSVLTVAHAHAVQAGIADRYELLPGSAFETRWRGPYDLVLLTNFLHHFSLEQCEQIARKAYESLVPGGRAVTLEFIPNEDRVSPPGTATFALTMLATTAHGDAYTFPEYERVLRRAGFERNEFSALPPTMQQVIVSHRPE